MHTYSQFRKHALQKRTLMNADFQLCKSYPPILWVPRSLDSTFIRECAYFRSQGRFPTLAYFYKRYNNALLRCAQPLVGIRGRRSEADEIMIEEVRKAAQARELFVFDARSNLAADGNKLLGKGSESPNVYRSIKLRYLEIANIHVVRESFDALRVSDWLLLAYVHVLWS